MDETSSEYQQEGSKPGDDCPPGGVSMPQQISEVSIVLPDGTEVPCEPDEQDDEYAHRYYPSWPAEIEAGQTFIIRMTAEGTA